MKEKKNWLMKAVENKFEIIAPTNDFYKSEDCRYMLLLKDLELAHQKFVDKDFTPSAGSLIADWDAPAVQDRVERWACYNWKRADKISALNKGR